MNNLLFAVVILLILYYFYYRSKSISSPPNPKPLTQSISTQTNLSDKQISLLTQQWNQVATWAKELGIDTNRSWNLTLLKNKIKQEQELEKGVKALKSEKEYNKDARELIQEYKQALADKEKKPIKHSRSTQTDPDSDLESTLDNLLNSIRDLNNQL